MNSTLNNLHKIWAANGFSEILNLTRYLFPSPLSSRKRLAASYWRSLAGTRSKRIVRYSTMDLRPRQRLSFVGFTESEVRKMNHLLDKFKEETQKDDFCKNLARVFNRSSGRAGKPVAKWTEIQNWFQKNLQKELSRETSLDAAKNLRADPDYLSQNRETTSLQMSEKQDEELTLLEFEAKSSKDGAWYDVDTFLSHRFLSSGEIEFLVRYVGFGAEEDEWINVGDSLRERSIALDCSECHKVNVGDPVLCFQDRDDQGRYFDACVIEIQRRWHDIRGCRCLFLIRYDHDSSEERVRLRRLCYRPNIPAKVDEVSS